MEQIINDLKDNFEDSKKVEENIQSMLEKVPSTTEKGKINIGQLADLLDLYKETKGQLEKLIQELYQLEVDVEVKKIEVSSDNTRTKVDQNLEKIDELRSQFENTCGKVDE